jgi:glyoxylase-like metal-dependent hydrolase (beta-lactamase superfamily II)
VGAFTVTALHDGVFVRDRPAGFIKDVDDAEVDRVFMQAGYGSGKLVLSFTAFAVEAADRLILIDAGFGENGPPSTGRLTVNLAAAGYASEQVESLLISHFHGDHISGLVTKDGSAVYPNAKVHVPRPEWDFWMDDGRMADAPDGLRPNFELCRKVFGALDGQICQFDWDDEILEGITALGVAGHTPGMAAFDIRSDGERLLYVADVSNNPAIFARQPAWRAAFDMDGDAAVSTRKRVFDAVSVDNTRVAYFHAPFPGLGHIVRQGESYVYVPQLWGAGIS